MTSIIITAIGIFIVASVIYEIYHMYTDKPETIKKQEVNKNE